LEDEKQAHAETQKELNMLKESFQQLEINLSQERSARVDAEQTLESLRQEMNAAQEANDHKKQEEARIAMSKMVLGEKEKAEAMAACQLAYDALKGLTTDDKKVAQAVGPHSIATLQLMKQTYLSNFGKELSNHIQRNTGGNFRAYVLGLLDLPDIFVVKLLRTALKGLGTDDDALIDLICPASNEEIANFKALYNKEYSRDLYEDVLKGTSGELKRIMTVVLQGKRDTTPADPTRVTADVEALHAAGEGKTIGTDFEPFLQVLGNRSPSVLAALNDAYASKQKKDKKLEVVLNSQFSGKVLKAFLAMLLGNINRPLYYANVLEDAFKGIGCDEVNVIRVLLSRREKDLDAIRAAYDGAGHKQSFIDRVKDELSGDLRRAVLLNLTGSME
jgi:hypothetical protein